MQTYLRILACGLLATAGALCALAIVHNSPADALVAFMCIWLAKEC